jgi:F-type H+-transporting ATPase subunit b
MKKLLILISLLPLAVFANEAGHGGDTDIIPRTVNFAIFAAIAYYLFADKVRNFFEGRTHGIAQEFDAVQAKLRDSLQVKEEAATALSEAKKTATEIVKMCEHDAALLVNKVNEQKNRELALMEEHVSSFCDNEARKGVLKVVRETLDHTIALEDTTVQSSFVESKLQAKVA